jgi:hypothetical protein
MKNYSFDEIRIALDELEARVGHHAPKELQEEFALGLHPNLLAYDKAKAPALTLTALARYLVGARSSLHQPIHFYDIFNACRHVKVVQLLNHSLKVLTAHKTKGLDARIERLLTEKLYDRFDSGLFELLVAARYAERPGVHGLEFVEETPKEKTPDFRMRQHGSYAACECKKMDRSQDFALQMHEEAKACVSPALAAFRSQNIAALAEVVFLDEPTGISSKSMVNACIAAVKSGTTIIERDFRVQGKRLPDYDSPTYKLYPSPDFFWYRYGYRVRGDWMGITHEVIGSRTNHFLPNSANKHGSSSWLDEIGWDSAIKWRFGSEALMAKYRRFGFDTLFGGLKQIAGHGRNSSVHLWLESNYNLGGREEALEDLRARISANGTNNFGWIVVNETLLDISPKGAFDLIEHAHYMRGPIAVGRSAEVTNVFTTGVPSSGAFGRGTDLPDIDKS